MKRLSSLFIFNLLCALFAASSLMAQSGTAPKREFRGAWIQCVNGQYLGKSSNQLRDMLSSQLDVLKQAGINEHTLDLIQGLVLEHAVELVHLVEDVQVRTCTA